MNKWSDKLTAYCVQQGIVCEKNAEWFKYGIEKRLSTICVAIPFFLLAVILSNFFTAFFFFLSFYTLRSKTNGFHAHTLLGCICLSLFIELTFFLIIYPKLNTITICAISLGCSIIIMILAPFNHPSMSYSEKERKACRSHARKINCIFLLVVIVTILLHLNKIAAGITLGIAMTTFMLCLAYILEWRKLQWKKQKKK